MFHPKPDIGGSSSSAVVASSTLVETVSINCEDFSESFLTCGTCLCVYDQGAHKPKLLPCSHTVCCSCLDCIIAVVAPDDTTFSCPSCRKPVTVLRSGAVAYPASFIVNQLLDLMMNQRRDVVPKCSTHTQSELMFCESCDSIFCLECTGGAHSNKGAKHTVIPFSVAIKRVSEILLYKAGLCTKNLDKAESVVSAEMIRLDQTADMCLEAANKAFQEVQAIVERRKQEVAETVRRVRDDKMRLLHEQLDIIDAEKLKVRNDCEGLQHQVEVRNITTKIGDLNEKLDMSTTLIEPRENAFMLFEPCQVRNPTNDTEQSIHSETGLDSIQDYARSNDIAVYGDNRTNEDLVIRPPINANLTSLDAQNCLSCRDAGLIQRVLARFGCIRISKTFPALCTATFESTPVTVHLMATVIVHTVDYHGNPRTTGGDPVCANIMTDRRGEKISTNVIDLQDGTYIITFKAVTAGRHVLNLTIFERCIHDAPFTIDVCAHNNPVSKIGGRGAGAGDLEFKQPVGIAYDRTAGEIFVLDTGNSRIQVLDTNGQFLRKFSSTALEQHSGTGITLSSHRGGTLFIVNWRSKTVSEICARSGETVRIISCGEFIEPICVTANRRGEIIVGDNGLGQVIVFDSSGSKVRTIGSRGDNPGQFQLISSIYSMPNDDILVCDHRAQLFSSTTGSLLYEFPAPRSRGQYGGVTVDRLGNFLFTRSEKGRCIIEVYTAARVFLFDIDSWSDRLKRPAGLVTTDDGFVYVVDLGNNCIKKFRYM